MRRALPVVLAGLVTGCSPSDGEPSPGELYIEWRGSSRGTFTTAASAHLCAENGLVELYGIRGDTGVGVLMLLADSTRVVERSLAVVSGGGTTEIRPSSRLALRFFDASGVRAFEGTSGTLDLTSVLDSALTGTLSARMQSFETTDTLQVIGQFRALPLGRAATGCGRAAQPALTSGRPG